jgi:hypothetical protein
VADHEASWEQRVEAAVARARPRLAAGAHVGEILRVFREDDHLGAIESMLALRELEWIDLGAAKVIVSDACAGRDFSHLGRAELEQLGAMPRGSLRTWLEWAILDGDPITKLTPRSSTQPFAELVAEIHTDLADPRWAAEVELVEETPTSLLLRFRRVRAKPAPR